MTQNDLKSRTPGALNAAAHEFVKRVADRDEAIGNESSNYSRGDEAPDPDINDTGLPLDNRGDGSVDRAAEDIDEGDDNQPESNNPDDIGEDESIVR
ncbi:MAG: hypothetical protein ACTHLA_03190 [Asticcacaulis sp.]|uniref:hypothetical protein n=1 Tax=Asticcacaulis sp. TaxID=1872648 RepID=UPI003F7BEE42